MSKDQVYERVTDQILELLSKGTVPWKKSWAGLGRPCNIVSNKPYSGFNLWVLACQPFSSPYWLTFRQAQSLGGTVKGGAKGVAVVFWKQLIVEDKATGDTKRIPMLRYYTVFSIEQTEGCKFPAGRQIEPQKLSKAQTIEAADNVVAGYKDCPQIEFIGGDKAAYAPVLDRVLMPPQATFESSEAYYSTLFHELAHSTGHEKRLDRDLSFDYGSETYGKEELVAEMTACFLTNIAGIAAPVVENAAAYLQGWIQKIRQDRSIVVSAATAARRASDYILGEGKPAVDATEAE